MKPSTDTLIREHVARYLAGGARLRELAAWITPIVLDAENLEPTARDLAYEIQLRLAEYSNGDWAETALRRMFGDLVRTHVLSIGERSVVTITNQSTAATLSSTGSSSFVGTVLEVAHA